MTALLWLMLLHARTYRHTHIQTRTYTHAHTDTQNTTGCRPHLTCSAWSTSGLHLVYIWQLPVCSNSPSAVETDRTVFCMKRQLRAFGIKKLQPPRRWKILTNNLCLFQVDHYCWLYTYSLYHAPLERLDLLRLRGNRLTQQASVTKTGLSIICD